jgi:uncharacterized protein (DUF427 family)
MNVRRKIQPGPGQESVWDYPRPPRVEDSSKHIRVILNGMGIADTCRTKRVLATSHPPVYSISPADIHSQYFTATMHTTFCEFKGTASYYTIPVGDTTIPNGAWYYAHPTHPYEHLAGYIARSPGKMNACTVDGGFA